MVRFIDIPEEKGKLDLEQLKEFMDAHTNRFAFIAIGEKVQKAVEKKGEEKTGGLNIQFITPVPVEAKYDVDEGKRQDTTYPDGLRLTQKYGKMAGRHLRIAMKELGYESTLDLYTRFHTMKLQPMRSGYARLIPVEAIEGSLPEDFEVNLPDGYIRPTE